MPEFLLDHHFRLRAMIAELIYLLMHHLRFDYRLALGIFLRSELPHAQESQQLPVFPEPFGYYARADSYSISVLYHLRYRFQRIHPVVERERVDYYPERIRLALRDERSYLLVAFFAEIKLHLFVLLLPHALFDQRALAVRAFVNLLVPEILLFFLFRFFSVQRLLHKFCFIHATFPFGHFLFRFIYPAAVNVDPVPCFPEIEDLYFLGMIHAQHLVQDFLPFPVFPEFLPQYVNLRYHVGYESDRLGELLMRYLLRVILVAIGFRYKLGYPRPGFGHLRVPARLD